MTHRFADVTYTDGVKAVQEHYGSRAHNERLQTNFGPNDQLGYAEFRGNTQLISIGNASSNDRCSLILMDYPNRRRLKILGHMRVEDARSVTTDNLAKVELPEYNARVESVVFIDVVAFDWNCPQHITRRYTESEFAASSK